MSHIHLPDGVLPLWIWLGGYAVSVLLLMILWRMKGAVSDVRRFALLGIFAALMVLTMTIEIPPFPYHVNLSVVTAIVLGLPLAILAAFAVNIFLAFLGHGGLTVIGLNALVLAVEMIIGYSAFRAFQRLRLPLALAGFLAVMLGLGTGTAASYGIIVLGAPAITAGLQAPAHAEATDAAREHAHEHEAEGDHVLEEARERGHLDLRKLAVWMFSVGVLGWILEGVLSTSILTALNRFNPALVRREE
jgi:cobalt/nickel transport system permease protein